MLPTSQLSLWIRAFRSEVIQATFRRLRIECVSSGNPHTVVIALLLLTSNANAGVRRVWAVNDSEKIERDATNHPASARNSVWDGRVVRVFGARNEVVAFQVIVEADARGVGALSVRLPTPGLGARPYHVPPSVGGSHRLRRPSHSNLCSILHARHDAVACVVGVRARIGGSPDRS